MSKNPKVDVGISRIWPWLLSYLWKNRNSFLFDGKCFDARELIRKAKGEADLWFLAQQVQSRMDSVVSGDVFNNQCSGSA